MLTDAIREYLDSTRHKAKEQAAGAHLELFYDQVVQENISITDDPDPLPEHYSELILALRKTGLVDVEIRLLRRVVASRLRDILVEKDAGALVGKILQIAKERQRLTINKAILRGVLRALDVEGVQLDHCVSYLKQLPTQKLTGVWRQRCEHYSLLDKPFGLRVADQLFAVDSTESAQNLLVSSGLRELGDLGIRQLVHRQLTVRLAKMLIDANGGDSDNLLALKVWERQAVGEAGFRFTGERLSTAESLLLPWKDNNPGKKLKDALLKFFLEHYGDPRRDSAWLGVSPEPQAIIRRWLAEASFELFISIIKEVAPDQWQEREKFWRYYLKNDYVLDLRVAFGSQASHLARKMNRESGLGEQLVFAQLKGASGDQSVMVMKLSRCTVVEWSHSGAFRLWRDGNNGAPSLLEREYRAFDVRSSSADENVVHSGPWLEKIGSVIHDYSGIPAQPPSSKRRLLG